MDEYLQCVRSVEFQASTYSKYSNISDGNTSDWLLWVKCAQNRKSVVSIIRTE